MSTPDLQKETTEKLQQIQSLDDVAVEQLLPVIYDELRRVASKYIRKERAGHPFQPTDLVHEAYVRLIDGTVVQLNDREHFLAIGAKVMRQVLVDLARRDKAQKRGGGHFQVTFSDSLLFADNNTLDILALNDALEKFQKLDERGSKVVELRFFANLSVEEVARILNVSVRTVDGDWAMAKAWLLRELNLGN